MSANGSNGLSWRERGGAGFWLPALLVFAFVAFVVPVLNDGDVFWHVRAGEWILDHRQVPVTDPFSFTFAGKPWHVHEWLSEVILALAWRAGGWGGVILLCAGAAGLAMGLLHDWLTARVSPVIAGLASLLVFACLVPSLLARPHLLAIPLVVAWARVLLDARDKGAAPRAWWLLLIVLWSNLHGTVLFGVGLAGLFALDALVERPAKWLAVTRDWAPFCIGALAAVLVTPSGLEGAVFLVRLTQMHSLASIREWQPTDLAHFQAVHLLVIAGIGMVLTRRVHVLPVRAGIILLLLVMTMQHQRHQMLLAVIGTMIVCGAMAKARKDGDREARAPANRIQDWLPPGLALILVAAVRLTIPVHLQDSATMPQSAFAHVPAALLGQPVLNGYDSGGYLIAQGVRPFIDGRTDLYGDDFIDRYSAILQGAPPVIARAIADYRIKWTFLPTGSGAAARFDSMPGWTRVYSDRFVTVHVRNEKGPG